MEYRVDMAPRQNPHVNYEPSTLGGLKESSKHGKDHEPHYDANLVRQKIDRTNDFGQAGKTYRAFDDVERNELISNLVDALKICKPNIQNTMVDYFTNADPNYGKRVREGLENAKREMTEHMSTAAADKVLNKSENMGHKTDGY
jgi:catalase